MASKTFKQTTPQKIKVSAKNLYREKWSLPLTTSTLSTAKNGITTESEVLKVTQKFNGGMTYQVKGRSYMLSEYVAMGHPFLIVFAFDPEKSKSMNISLGMPEQIKQQLVEHSLNFVKKLVLPTNLHNIELTVTDNIANNLKLPESWSLVKAVMKVPIDLGQVACDCDVDGPCGYCCDTCDTCHSCDTSIIGELGEFDINTISDLATRKVIGAINDKVSTRSF